jgi:2-oxo-4-hydroxy-4-carboxy-5-ureidoimidazoline decarboxylase
MAPRPVADIDSMDLAAFTAALGAVVEHSPWVAEAAWARRPFGSRDGVHLAFEAAMRTAPPERRLQVLQAHPELAGSEAEAGTLTAASAAEQRAARLDELTAAELATLRALNADYRARFGFPFISCVREHSVASLLAWGAARLGREHEDEQTTALAEVGKIVGLRLRELVAA